jgi:hypothetical protein
MKMQQKLKTKWLKALRPGAFKQSQEVLVEGV